MSSQRYTPEFKDEVVERGYSVAEVAERLGVSAHSLYKWINAVKPDQSDAHANEIREAKRIHAQGWQIWLSHIVPDCILPKISHETPQLILAARNKRPFDSSTQGVL